MEVRKGFKQTDVGVIPEDWEVKPLGSLCDISAGGDLVKSDFSSVQDEKFSFPIYSNALTNKGLYGYSKAFQHEADKITVTARGDVGHANYRGTKFCAIGRVLVLSSKCPCDLRFVTEYINNFVEFALESTGVPQLTAPQISKYVVALPPTKAEQEAIADALSDADAFIEAVEQLLAKKRQVKQGAMSELLTGKRRLSGFSGEWNSLSFDEVLLRINAKAHQILASDYQAIGSYPVVDQGKQPIVGYSDRQDKCFKCPEGGVIVFGDHTCIVKFVDFDFLVGADGTQILKAKDGQHTHFHAFQLQHKGITPTGYNRHFKFLKEYKFLVPPLAEQTAIAEVLSDMDAEISALEEKLVKARQVKAGMMSELLGGRIRLV